MRLRARLLPAVFGLAAGPLLAQTNLSTPVSVGDSLAAGFVSGSLVEAHQVNSVPAHIARQAAVTDFQQPLVSEPGIPPEFALVSLAPPTLIPKPGQGSPKNAGLARPYNNLAVPGARVADALNRLTDGGGLHDLILRGRGSQVSQAASLRPTFVTLWIGNNDVLAAAVGGRAIDGVTLTPAADFRASYQAVVNALKATGAFIVAANLPDVSTIPFVTTVPPYVVNSSGQPVLVSGQRVPLLGPTGPLSPQTRVTLGATSLLAQGIGIPAALGGRGTPLPDEVILDPAEIAAIQARIETNNRAIAEICQAAAVPVFDIHALLEEFFRFGRLVGGVTLTSAFLSGGIFSYDGVHPTDLGYALVANEWIRVINANGGSLPEVDLEPYMGVKAASLSRSSPGAVLSLEAYAALRELFGPIRRD